MESHLIIYDEKGNVSLNLQERLTRLVGKVRARDIPNRVHTIKVPGIGPGQKVWVAPMGPYLFASVNGDTINWSFSMSQEQRLLATSIRDFKLDGWILYGIY
mgnify:CR=1 FL=1